MKTILALGVLLVAGAGVATAQEPAARPDTAKAAAKWDSASAHKEHAAPGQQAMALDLNTATKPQLEAAGLGPYADKIMQGRPFKSTQELVDKKILPPEAVDNLKGKVKFGPS